jgi:hypothetical protein
MVNPFSTISNGENHSIELENTQHSQNANNNPLNNNLNPPVSINTSNNPINPWRPNWDDILSIKMHLWLIKM